MASVRRRGLAWLMVIVGLTLVVTATPSRVLAQDSSAATKAVSPSNFDTTCGVCSDFFRYVNGTWLDRTSLGWTGTGVNVFGEIQERGSRFLVSAVLDAAAESPSPPHFGSTARDTTKIVTGDSSLATAKRMVGAFYNRCMESTTIEAAGITPIAPWLKRIDAIGTPAALMTTMAALDRDDILVALHVVAGRDRRGTGLMIASISRDGLGLPDPKLYARTDSTAEAMRAYYLEHVTNVLVLLGMPRKTAASMAPRVVALEQRLASYVPSDSARRDPHTTFHPMTVAELGRLTPSIAWPRYFDTLGVSSSGTLNVEYPVFMATLDTVVRAVPLATWRAYLKIRLADAMQNALTSTFPIEYGTYNAHLQGIPATGGSRNCFSETVYEFRDAVGRLYVEKSFSPGAKARGVTMVRNITTAMRGRLQAVPWMSAETKAQALAKLDSMVVKIGFPDRWRDYSGLTLTKSSYPQNLLEIMRFERRWDLARIGRPIDHTEWDMSPSTVNAYYSPEDNEMVFPAAVLAPPFFDSTADDASNYGSIGAAIGHEMTHAFDDQGRQFDAQGRLRDWWTAADAKEFAERSKRLVDQYASYIAVDTNHVNGRLTLGENIADLGGILVAYDAFQLALADKPRTPIDGFTPEQRFFIAFANVWRGKTRPDALKLEMLTDPHSPHEWRTNGVLPNVPSFAKAFQCQSGTPLAPPADQRVVIW